MTGGRQHMIVLCVCQLKNYSQPRSGELCFIQWEFLGPQAWRQNLMWWRENCPEEAKGGARLYRSFATKGRESERQTINANYRRRITEVKAFSTFLCMRRCKSLGSLKSFPWYAPQLWGFPGGSAAKESACSAGDSGSTPRSGRSPGEENGTHCRILAWRIPWTEEPGGPPSTGSQRVRGSRFRFSPCHLGRAPVFPPWVSRHRAWLLFPPWASHHGARLPPGVLCFLSSLGAHPLTSGSGCDRSGLWTSLFTDPAGNIPFLNVCPGSSLKKKKKNYSWV